MTCFEMFLYNWEKLQNDLLHLRRCYGPYSQLYQKVSIENEDGLATGGEKFSINRFAVCRACFAVFCLFCMPVATVAGTIALTVNNRTPSLQETIVKNNETLHEIQRNIEENGPVFWLATYPHSGNTWVRQLWSHSTNTTTGAVYHGHYGNKGSFRGIPTFKSDNPCKPKIYCNYIHKPVKDAVFLVKTHFPVFGNPEKEIKIVARGVITTIRSPSSWCNSHADKIEGWDFRKNYKNTNCTSFVKDRMRYHQDWWAQTGYNILTIDYDFMKLSVSNARYEMQRIFKFTGVTGTYLEEALRVYPPK